MESLGALMMVIALSWPIAGGAIVGLIGGILRGHGLVGTIIDIVAGAILGYALVMGFMIAAQNVQLPDPASLVLTLGLPLVGGLIGLAIGGRFRRG